MPGFEPIEIKCGQLITNSAPESVGLKDYTVKRDWRRIAQDRDARREGYFPFQPNQAHATTPANLPSLSDGTIQKITEVRAGNGKTAVIVANQGFLYRYFSLENGGYFSGDQTPDAYFDDTVEQPYFQESFNDWVQIGSGFSGLSNYWEAVQVNNILVLNNGIDLPVTYNIQDQTVTPIYELRDQGIASVGTIWEYNGILMLGDIVEISDAVNPGQNESIFYQLMASDIRYARFSDQDPSNLTYTAQQVDQMTDHFQYRVIWSMPGEPSRFAASIPCATEFGSQHITLQWPSKSFSNGQQILVLGAGVNGGNITATILWINPTDGTDLYLDTAMLATIAVTSVQSLDSVGSIVGYEDLDDDGSAVIRGAVIRTSAVIYKDTSIFICNYTGVTAAPFSFARVYTGGDSIYYRNTLVSIVHDWQSWHFFAGRNHFYRFDLISLTPTPIAKEVENLFFANASNLLAYPQFVFAADNTVTKEIFVANPFGGGTPWADSVICIDYIYNTISTSSAFFSCAGTVQFPTANIVEQGVSVFLMGEPSIAAVLQYGLMNDGSAPVFSRGTPGFQDAAYQSTLASGLGAVGSLGNDTMVNGYECRIANLTGRVTLSLTGENNPGQTQTFFSVDRTAAGGAIPKLFIPCGFITQTVADSIVVTDADVQCEVTSRIIMAKELNTMGVGRT